MKIAKLIPVKIFSFKTDINLNPADLQKARKYIKNYYPKITVYHPKDDQNLLGLPHPYIVPSKSDKISFDFSEMYYWDSYFIVQGLLDSKNKDLVIGILDNLIFMFKKFKVIPNASRIYLFGRSQPPFLTSLIFDIYQKYNLDNKWLKDHIKVAEDEYTMVWLNSKHPFYHKVFEGLSRYYDVNNIHDLAEAESGWDLTPRFNHHALDYLPIDLNCLLYKYELDFARFYKIIGETRKSIKWEDRAEQRKKAVNKLMWDESKKFFFDYDFTKNRRSSISSLAAYYSMWSGLASKSQAQGLIKNLRKFEHRGGLSTTDQLLFNQFAFGAMPTQWAFPNGWAPLHYLVIKGLERYGYHQDARRIAIKWLKTNLNWFNKEHIFLEKYNVVNPDKPPIKGIYPSQDGFGWTNAIFERLSQEYVDRSF